MPDNRHKGSRNAMSCAVNDSNKLPVAIIVHPVEVATNNIFRHKKDKSFLESIFPGKHGPLYTLGISYASRNIPVFLFYLHALLNHLFSSFFHLFFKHDLFFYKVLFPDFYIYNHNCHYYRNREEYKPPGKIKGRHYYKMISDRFAVPHPVTIARYHIECCLLYTSDAADEEDSVDLGDRRIIKTK